jgi:peroxiredoxin
MKMDLTLNPAHPPLTAAVHTAQVEPERLRSRRIRLLAVAGGVFTLLLVLAVSFVMLANLWWTGLATGQPAPDFAGSDLNGNPVRLSDLGGQPVLLTFWSPECFACREELPTLQAIAADPHAAVQLVTIVSYPHAEAVRDFVQAEGLTFPVIMDEQAEITSLYKVRGVPFTYLIDPTGRIEGKVIGAGAPGELHNQLTAWLKTCNVNTACQ